MSTPAKTLPVRQCPMCGSTWFREVTLHEFVEQRYMARWPDFAGIANAMPMSILICLCGAPLRPALGGIRGGRTPNVEVGRFFQSFDSAERQLEARRNMACVDTYAHEKLIRTEQLGKFEPAIGRLERQVGRMLALKTEEGKIKGGVWRRPTREPASTGRDRFALELQKRGLTFHEARAVINVIWDSIKKALMRGETVETPLGEFRVQPRTKQYNRLRLGKFQVMHRRRNKVVFSPAGECRQTSEGV